MQNIIGSRSFTPPDEMQAVKDYVQRHYQSKCFIKLDRGTLVLSVPSSALAGTLQLERNKVIKDCNLKSRLLIRTGCY